MTIPAVRRLRLWLHKSEGDLRLTARVTVAALIAYVLATVLNLPQGYWAVFTAIIVIQGSAGGSLKAAVDRIIGTMAGAIYGVAVALVIPLDRPEMLGLALLVALAPLALLASLYPMFRVSTITAIIILLNPANPQSGVFEPAVARVFEIGIGSVVGVAVSFLVLPSRAHGIVTTVVGKGLRLCARLTAALFAGFGGSGNMAEIVRLQDGLRRVLIGLDAAVKEAERERANHLTSEPDPVPLFRTLRRLRLDLVIIARATTMSLPDMIRERLSPSLRRIAETVGSFLAASADALETRRQPPSGEPMDQAIADYAAAMAEVRREGLTRDLPDDQVGRIFALSFALEQLRRDLGDLSSRAAEFARE